MRILLASDHYVPFIGGAHRQVALLAHLLQERGHDVTVATVWHGGLPGFADGDVPVYRIRQLRTALPSLVRDQRQRHQPPFPDPLSVVQLRRIIKHSKPQVIHSYGWISYSCAAALRGLDIPLMISARDYGYACARRDLLYKGRPCTGPTLGKCLGCASEYYGGVKGPTATLGVLLSRPLLRQKVRAIHSISTYVRDTVRRDFLPTADTLPPITEFVLPSFGAEIEVDATDELDASRYLSLLPDEPFILFVGAFRRAKGIDILFQAYDQLQSPPPLVLIGTFERDTPPIPDHVLALEDFPHAAVMAAWQRALFGVFPSLWPEPLGSVVYEAMSCGKAVIGTMPGGQTDMIIDGESGFLVPQGDAAALATAMERLVSNTTIREAFGKASRQRARLFRADVVVPQLERVYEELIETEQADRRPPCRRR